MSQQAVGTVPVLDDFGSRLHRQSQRQTGIAWTAQHWMVEVEHRVGDYVSKERRYHIMSPLGKAFGREVSSYWGFKKGLQ